MQPTNPIATDSIPSDMSLCIEAWKNCHQVTMDTMNHCMQMGEQYMDLSLLCSLRDCAEMCLMCVNLMMDGSEFVGRTGLICAEMCLKCAKACETFGRDAQLQHCAQVCRDCADRCKSVGTNAESYFRRANLVTEQALLQVS